MRYCKLLAVLILGLLLPFSVGADKCEIEDWKSTYSHSMKTLEIQGVATCRGGLFVLRLYEGEGQDRKFYGVENAFIEGYAFRAILFQVEEPENLTFEYTFESW